MTEIMNWYDKIGVNDKKKKWPKNGKITISTITLRFYLLEPQEQVKQIHLLITFQDVLVKITKLLFVDFQR